jgi:hypothetical protein
MSQSHNRHLSDRLIRTIEVNAEEFAQGTVKKLQTSVRTESYHRLSHDDVYDRCYEIYHNLGLWLWEKSDHAIQTRYNELGQRRFQEGVPLAQVLWALVLTKERLLEYLGGCGLVDSAMDLYQQQEFVQLIDHFFDRAVCYTGEGYERQAHETGPGAMADEGHDGRRAWLPGRFHRNAANNS